MDILIVYPDNMKQLAALKAVMKAMEITFEQKSEIYHEHVINGVKESLIPSEEGKLIPYKGIKDMLNMA